MYTEEPYRSPHHGLTKAFVVQTERMRRHQQRLAELRAERADVRAERAKLARTRKEATRAIRAMRDAVKAVEALQREQDATRRAQINAPRTMASIVALISRATGIPTKVIYGPSQASKIVLARHAVMYWCVRRTNKSYPQIGQFLDRDHTTVFHGAEVYVTKRARMGRTLRRVR
jgi:chromosomal replication initiation ATPase DnaA